ncbi:phosphoribosyltransferase family protein [Lacipirellula parvula]|uniref:Orotate phosphoribosyltransferase n=1 Tax=Lacipirellula parvula TaxID=2650471 RepID=A0A5K7X3L9_9BACT|nr:phosphoribosyltransferase family protein [Lacipirellula parvula]BBO30965.1 orotate phosphoribosyltransferase [Lacipirellula parvula]
MPDQSDAAQAAAETQQMLVECRALLADDHFVYISGDHGSGWVDKDAIFVDLQRVRQLTQLLAAAVRDLKTEILCGPATGGLIVAQWTAYELGLPAVFAEHTQPRTSQQLRGEFTFHRGYDRLVTGRRVLVVDDVVNTGLSVRQTVAAVQAAGGEVVAAAALVHRGNVDAAGLSVPEYRYLMEYDIPDWTAAECPLCRAGVPVNTRYAHGQDYLDAQQQRAADA